MHYASKLTGAKSLAPRQQRPSPPDSESELVVDDAKPDLRRVDRHLLADECVLGSGVHVAKRTFEASALADRTRAGNQMGPFGAASGNVGCVHGGGAHV